jgi:hypothetical protein
MVPGVELVAAYLIAWAVRKAKRIGAKADSEVDRLLDAGTDRLHELIAAKLGGDPAVAQLDREAPSGEVSDRTRRRVEDAVAQAADDDPAFADDLRRILDELAEARRLRVTGTGSITQSSISGVAMANTGQVGGNIEVHGPGRPADGRRPGRI